VVLQRTLRPDAADAPAPAGWHVAVRDPVRTVWVRDRPLGGPGRVSWSSAGVRVLADTSAPERETVRYAAGQGGQLLFARLAWPGYTATVDGRPATTSLGPAGLLRVDVPAGEHDVVVGYRAPGLAVGKAAALAAVAVALLQTAAAGVAALRRRRPRALPGNRSRR
jgi:hypothetical protein